MDKISGTYGTETIICGGGEEEEAETVKQSVWRGTFLGQGVGTCWPGKRRNNVLKRSVGVKMGTRVS